MNIKKIISKKINYKIPNTGINDELELNFGEFGGSVPANVFYADTASNNDKVCWTMVLEG